MLYGFIYNGGLYQIDTTTAALTFQGSTGFDSNTARSGFGLAYDYSSATFFLSSAVGNGVNGTTLLHSFTLATIATPTLIGSAQTPAAGFGLDGLVYVPAEQFWDGPQTAPDGVVNGGSGIWNNAVTNWTDSAGVLNSTWEDITAVFTGAAGTVTVGENVKTTGMQFLTDGYVISAADAETIALLGGAVVRVGTGLTATIDAPLTGSGSLFKSASGTLVLNAINTYGAGTTVSGGALIVNGSITSAVTVATDARLGGTGTIAGAVMVENFAVLAPGGTAGPGTLTLGNLTLNNSSYLDFDLGRPGFIGGGTNDLLQVNGNLVLDGQLRVANAGGFDVGTYRLMNYTGSLTDNELLLTRIPPGFPDVYFTIETSVAGQVNFVAQNTAAPLLFWDGAGTVADNVVEGGSGTWDNVATNWTDSAGANQSAWSGSRAVFTGAAGTVTLGEDVMTTGMQFVTDGYVIDRTAAETIELDGASTLRVDAGATATINAPLTGTGGSLFKNSPGTLVLNGINTYRFGTTVSGGTLIVNGSIAATSSVNVAAGATLGGAGEAKGSATIANGGTLSPGVNGPGMLTLGALNLNPTSDLRFDLGMSGVVGGVTNDLLAVGDNLILDGILNITDAGGFGVGSYRLINYGGLLTNNGLSFGAVPPGFSDNLAVDTSAAGQVNLIVSSGAALLFWDGAQLAANGVVDGGSSTWDNARTNWTNSAGSFQRAWTGASAVFAGSAGAVTVGENVSTTGLRFSTTGYIIDASAGKTITLDGAVPIRVDAGVSVRINAPLSGGSFTKTGDGTLTLAGGSTYSGGTSLVDGTILVANAAGTALGTGPVTVFSSPTSELRFIGNSSAGGISLTTSGGGTPDAFSAGLISFLGTATAGSATITNNGNAAPGADGGGLLFDETSRAGTATILNHGATFRSPTAPGLTTVGGGQTTFFGTTANAAAITNFAGLGNGFQGGKTVFRNNSSTGVAATAGTATITNRGGAVTGAIGGLTIFSGDATSASATLIAEGGTNGGLGGTIRFSDTSDGGTARAILEGGAGFSPGGLDISRITNAGMSIGSIEGGGIVSLGRRNLAIGTNNLDTEFSGLIRDGGFVNETGGSLTKLGTGTLTLLGDSTYTGGTDVSGGTLRATNPDGKALGTGSVSVRPGSRLHFAEAGAAGSNSVLIFPSIFPLVDAALVTFTETASAGTGQFTLNGSSLSLISSAAFASFRGNSSAGSASFVAFGGQTNNGSTGGDISFADDSTAGAATFTIHGGGVAGADSADLFFSDRASGEAAVITNRGTSSVGAFGRPNGGFTSFSDDAAAGSATIINQGALANGGSSGIASFVINASAGTSNITNQGGAASGALGGNTRFRLSATASAATILNMRGTVNGALGGVTEFSGAASGGTATITNQGALSGSAYGVTEFRDTSNAQTATFFNGASLSGGGFGGRPVFSGSSTAANATFDNEGAKVVDGYSGEVFFTENSTAGASNITNHGSSVADTFQSSIAYFFGNAKAGTATILNEGSAFTGQSGFAGGWTQFHGNTSAEQATIFNRAGTALNGHGGTTEFFGTTAGQTVTADRATITNDGGLFAARVGGRTNFTGTATAGTAIFTNIAGQAPFAFGGTLSFGGTSTAGAAAITNEGAALAMADGGATIFSTGSKAGTATIFNRAATLADGAGGFTSFLNSASAEQSVIRSRGAAVAGAGNGYVRFFDNSNADRATLYAEAGVGTAPGGALLFDNTSEGGTARAILEGGAGLSPGGLDISLLSDAGMSIGSIEGGGIVSLGRRNLRTGLNNLSTTFSGLIRDGGIVNETGGSFNVVGSGALTLSGANTYTGPTAIGNGVTANSGKLIAGNISGSATGTGTVFVNNGGTLSGSGFIAGPVILRPGGTIAPGDPVTLTLENDLLWDGDSTIRLALGPDQAGSDLLQINGALTRGAGGVFRFELVDFGAVVGQSYELIHFNSLQGFTASDFSFSGVEGNFTVGANAVGVQVTAVPEPGCSGIIALGALTLGLRRRRNRRAESQPDAQ